jgi:hypothetical protein
MMFVARGRRVQKRVCHDTDEAARISLAILGGWVGGW